MGVSNLIGSVILTLLLGIGGGLLIASYTELRKNEEDAPGSRAKGRQLAAISASVLFISIVGFFVLEFFTYGKL